MMKVLNQKSRIRHFEFIGRMGEKNMFKLEVGEQEYKIKFGYNCFCDTNIMDRVQSIVVLFQESNVNGDQEVASLKKVKELFCIVRELIYWGLKKYNPIETLEEVGELLDQYKDEGEEKEENRGLFELFTKLSDELMRAGFLSDLMGVETDMKDGVKAPTDHKTAKK